jgi:voltage-gated potassium channel
VPSDESSKELGPFQLALFVLSVILLVALGIELLAPIPAEVRRLVFFIDTAICGLLFVDFWWRFAHAPSKRRFMRWGWLDLIASIPAVEALRWGRLFRIVRVIRLVVAFRSFRRLAEQLVGSRRQTGIASVMMLTVLIVSFASIGVLLAETDPLSNIKTAEDALWWSMTTITTVGYGDRFPVTDIGRLIASILMVCGIGLFGTLSGVAASFFLGTAPTAEGQIKPAVDSVRALEERVARLERDVGR